jgi:hypothetical protein
MSIEDHSLGGLRPTGNALKLDKESNYGDASDQECGSVGTHG